MYPHEWALPIIADHPFDYRLLMRGEARTPYFSQLFSTRIYQVWTPLRLNASGGAWEVLGVGVHS